MRALVLTLLLSFVPALATAQSAAPVILRGVKRVDTLYVYRDNYSPLAGAIATTGCMGGKIYQAIDMEFIGDSLWDEVVAHEAVHRRQYERHLTLHSGKCPTGEDGTGQSAADLLAWEIEAYCEVRHIRLERGWAQAVVDAEYIDRMQNQFKGQLKKEHIAVLYRLGCP